MLVRYTQQTSFPQRPRTPMRRRARRPFSYKIIGVLVALVLILLYMVPISLLSQLGLHYTSVGGNPLEKIHPATFVALLAFLMFLFASGHPVQTLENVVARSPGLLVHFLGCMALLFHITVDQGTPFTVVVDTFIGPIFVFILMTFIPVADRRPMVLLLHWMIFINVVLGFYEYFSGSHLIVFTAGGKLIRGDWRPTALLSHPLQAACLIGAYTIAIALQPNIIRSRFLRLAMIMFYTASLMVFGGRTALVLVLLTFAGAAVIGLVHLVRGRRISPMSIVISLGAFFIAASLIGIAASTGIFDRMIERFYSDNGSAQTRVVAINLLSYLDWRELLFGPDASRASSLEAMLGLGYGVENAWIAFVVQFGLVYSVIFFLGLIAFWRSVLNYTAPVSRVLTLYIVIIASGSNSFSSKTCLLSQLMMLLLLLTPRQQVRAPRRAVPVTFAPRRMPRVEALDHQAKA